MNMANTYEPKLRKRVSRKINAQILKDTAERLGLTLTDFSQACGMSDGWASECLRTGEAPEWSALACECLLARKGKKVTEDAVLVVRVPAGKMATVADVLTALGCETKAV